ncbi:glycine cleavage system protein GcvH [Desulfobacterota bacterium]|jgi:glycine cleavage system H protein|nr:glycine cleavage system protein GcvH [Thermodesulfobacteriota bacterium]|tara:strand:+ start:12996 stop:13379 length:384 start_codon:yes stop_codon:yes gene_type:complete
MSEIIKDLKYSNDHEWIRLDGDHASIGITDHAQDSLGEIVFVELPKVGDVLEKSSIFGAVESTKSVSDLYTPVAGTVTEVNASVENEPELINSSPYREGWMIKISPTNVADIETLLSSEEYKNLIDG